MYKSYQDTCNMVQLNFNLTIAQVCAQGHSRILRNICELHASNVCIYHVTCCIACKQKHTSFPFSHLPTTEFYLRTVHKVIEVQTKSWQHTWTQQQVLGPSTDLLLVVSDSIAHLAHLRMIAACASFGLISVVAFLDSSNTNI